MKIRSFEEIYNDLMDINFEPIGENVITGEEYEDWIKTRFITAIDSTETVKISSDAIYKMEYKMNGLDCSDFYPKNTSVFCKKYTLLDNAVERTDLNIKFSLKSNNCARETNQCNDDFSAAA